MHDAYCMPTKIGRQSLAESNWQDLSCLIESNLQERQQLAEVNTALSEVSHRETLKVPPKP